MTVKKKNGKTISSLSTCGMGNWKNLFSFFTKCAISPVFHKKKSFFLPCEKENRKNLFSFYMWNEKLKNEISLFKCEKRNRKESLLFSREMLNSASLFFFPRSLWISSRFCYLLLNQLNFLQFLMLQMLNRTHIVILLSVIYILFYSKYRLAYN